ESPSAASARSSQMGTTASEQYASCADASVASDRNGIVFVTVAPVLVVSVSFAGLSLPSAASRAIFTPSEPPDAAPAMRTLAAARRPRASAACMNRFMRHPFFPSVWAPPLGAPLDGRELT